MSHCKWRNCVLSGRCGFARFIAALMRKSAPRHDRPDAEHEHGVGRATDLDVEAIGVVPPVIERGRGEHGDAAPGGEKGTEGARKPKMRTEEATICGARRKVVMRIR